MQSFPDWAMRFHFRVRRNAESLYPSGHPAVPACAAPQPCLGLLERRRSTSITGSPACLSLFLGWVGPSCSLNWTVLGPSEHQSESEEKSFFCVCVPLWLKKLTAGAEGLWDTAVWTLG